MCDPRLIVALDYASTGEASRLVDRLGERVSFYKVGLQLLADNGMQFAWKLKREGKKVFLDWKLHDIPHTVENAARRIAEHGGDFLTVHARDGAVAAALRGVEGTDTRILAVTVLTSMPRDDWTDKMVSSFARISFEQGAHGIVSSGHELPLIERRPDRLYVTPGIRLPDQDADDQHRIMSPSDALRAGATHLVVGRPITRATNPVAAVDRIIDDMKSVA